MRRIIILSIFALISIIGQSICYEDDQYQKLFKVEEIQSGDKINYPKIGNKLVLHFTGWYSETKRKFESSHDKKEPATIIIGKGMMIECWERVLLKISLGEKIKFVCPHSLAYGIEGVRGKIPPKTNLLYEVELIKIIEGNFEEDL